MSTAAILKLRSSGFSDEQVSALAELIDTQAATKSDLDASEHRLEFKISDIKTGLELKIAELKTGLDTKIADVKTGLELKITALDGRINLLQWMIGFTLAFQLAIFFKLFIH